MKKVLVTGAAGCIGREVIKYLLSEGKYEITVLDLKNKKSFKRLKKYKKRVNVIYGDATDRILMESLIKDHDFILHLASILPPFADLQKSLANTIEYESLENIVRAINYYNPDCHLFFASSTTIYGNSIERVNVDSKIKIEEFDYYAKTKYKCEERIKAKLNNYTIIRIPLVLSSISKEPFMYNVDKNSLIETITNKDAAYAFIRAINVYKKVNQQTLNIGGGNDFIFTYKDLLNNILKYYGLSFKYILFNLFVDKNYYSPVLSDSNYANEILDYRLDSLDNYYSRLKRSGKKRYFAKFLAMIYLKINKGKK